MSTETTPSTIAEALERAARLYAELKETVEELLDEQIVWSEELQPVRLDAAPRER